ncbi:hypothetical protein [Tsuneonella dongtanensis]|uniref:hypothetical protein n=1 Tax=Tsuneonella dongtanensis TaxID=692370 RepID=UPI000834DEC8|nr:hypothetical protein [Tsuneonella dongtanensis]
MIAKYCGDCGFMARSTRDRVGEQRRIAIANPAATTDEKGGKELSAIAESTMAAGRNIAIRFQ